MVLAKSLINLLLPAQRGISRFHSRCGGREHLSMAPVVLGRVSGGGRRWFDSSHDGDLGLPSRWVGTQLGLDYHPRGRSQGLPQGAARSGKTMPGGHLYR